MRSSGIVAEGRRVHMERVRIVRQARTDVLWSYWGPPCVHTRGGLIPPLVPWRENFCV